MKEVANQQSGSKSWGKIGITILIGLICAGLIPATGQAFLFKDASALLRSAHGQDLGSWRSIAPAKQREERWLIDAEQFHGSVHGQLSCQDCHGDVAARPTHPNPSDVNKNSRFFFRVEQCVGCHDDVLEEIESGIHGDLVDRDPQALMMCIDCHDPHYESDDSLSTADWQRPAEEKCSRCHAFEAKLPEPSAEDQACLACHRSIAPQDPRAAKKAEQLCLACHGHEAGSHFRELSEPFPLIDTDAYASTAHSRLSCMTCHPEAASFAHADQRPGDCRQCHHRHDEKVAHDAHMTVSCEACHLSGVQPVKNEDAGTIGWLRGPAPERISVIHQMAASEENRMCRRCHVSGNTVGAAAMVLPPKSVLCMPCHASTFTAGDTVSVISLLGLALGMLSVASIWMSGTVDGSGIARFGGKLWALGEAVLKALFSRRVFVIFTVLVRDGLFQYRLFRYSRFRWTIHALVFFPFVFRFVWGAAALIASLCVPQLPFAWAMLDKNNALTGFLFDLSGVLILAGAALMVARRAFRRTDSAPMVSSPPDWPAIGLMGGIVVVGFVLESMRIAMTGWPPGAQFAFLGYAISRLFAGYDVSAAYGWVWYIHAILTGSFAVYLPFSRMFHIIMAPVTLAVNAASAGEHGRS